MVGEGLAEVALATHLRALYTRGNAGAEVTVRNARGKGARHVVDYAIRQRHANDYNEVCALLDADTDWNERTQSLARKGGIRVVLSDPCLECSLLRVVGVQPPATTHECKERFLAQFGGPAHQEGLIARSFQREHFDRARDGVEMIAALMAAMRV